MAQSRQYPSLRGQAMTESIVLLPFFLLLAFGLLQLGQLGTAVIVANYAASAIARQAVQDGTTGNSGAYEARFASLLMVGMKAPDVGVTVDPGLLSDVTVHACAQIDAFPFLGQFLSVAIGQKYNGGGGCGTGGLSMGPLYFNGVSPYAFRVHGKATARMNYQPTS